MSSLPPLDFRECWVLPPHLTRDLKQAHKHSLVFIAQLQELVTSLDACLKAEKSAQQAYEQLNSSINGTCAFFDSNSFAPKDVSKMQVTLFIDQVSEQRKRTITSLELRRDAIKEMKENMERDLNHQKETHKGAKEKYFSTLEKHLTGSAKKTPKQLEEETKACEQLLIFNTKTAMDYILFLNISYLERPLFFKEMVMLVVEMGSSAKELGRVFEDNRSKAAEVLESIECHVQANETRTANGHAIVNELLKEPLNLRNATPSGYAGNLMIQTKGLMGTSWHRYYCTYSRAEKNFAYFKDAGHAKALFSVDSCVQLFSDDIDRKFVFQISGPNNTVIAQAMGESDRKAWIGAMGGLAPIKSIRRKKGKRSDPTLSQFQHLSPLLVAFMQKLIAQVERTSLDFEGLYRVSGQKTRYIRIYNDTLVKGKTFKLDMEDVAVLTSCLKHCFSQLEDSLLTQSSYNDFIDCVTENVDVVDKVANVKDILDSMEHLNYEVTRMLMEHLKKVTEYSSVNRMTISNISVVFGPTLMKPPPTNNPSQAMLNWNSQNAVVEFILTHFAELFDVESETDMNSNTEVSLSNDVFTADVDVGEKKQPQLRRHPAKATNRENRSYTIGVINSSTTTATDKGEESNSNFNRRNTEANAKRHSIGTAVGNKIVPVHRRAPLPPPLQSPPPVPDNKLPAHPSIPDEEFEYEDVDAVLNALSDSDEEETEDVIVLEEEQVERNKSTPFLPPRMERRKKKEWICRAIFDCKADSEGEISFTAGEIITDVDETEDAGWLTGTLQSSGETGLFPLNYVTTLKGDDSLA
eukprot:m.96976 g.96976  ORF g.96976 m.96976 type:complete len:806 (+) comp12480_c2_seq4:212-2629(+)